MAFPLYAQLIFFSDTPTFNNMYEAAITKAVYNWVGQAQEVLTSDYHFTVSYVFNYAGVANAANVKVEKKNSNGIYEVIGCYTVSGDNDAPPLFPIVCECNACVPSDIPSIDLPYYLWNTCDLKWNAISFKWNNRWYK